jgi:hypothetical protein
MSERGSVGDIVYRDHLKVFMFQSCAKKHSANPAEPVYSDPGRH